MVSPSFPLSSSFLLFLSPLLLPPLSLSSSLSLPLSPLPKPEPSDQDTYSHDQSPTRIPYHHPYHFIKLVCLAHSKHSSFSETLIANARLSFDQIMGHKILEFSLAFLWKYYLSLEASLQLPIVAADSWGKLFVPSDIFRESFADKATWTSAHEPHLLSDVPFSWPSQLLEGFNATNKMLLIISNPGFRVFATGRSVIPAHIITRILSAWERNCVLLLLFKDDLSILLQCNCHERRDCVCFAVTILYRVDVPQIFVERMIRSERECGRFSLECLTE